MSGSTTIGNVTYVPFNFTTTAPFQFQCTLDGNLYTIQTWWNLYGQRWWFFVFDQNGNQVVFLPLISSAPGANQNLLAGYFKDTFVYRNSTNQFEITTVSGD